MNRQILLEDWPGHTRRFTHLVLLGQRGKSLDSQIAFTLGVDSYIHIQDTPNDLERFFSKAKNFFQSEQTMDTGRQ